MTSVTDPQTITMLLHEAEGGDDAAMDRLMSLVYDDLQRIAQGHLRKQHGQVRGANATFEPAALVNESFMRLIRQEVSYENRRHFFGIATRIMLQVLIDHQRKKMAVKRGGGDGHITLAFDDRQVAGTAPLASIEPETLRDALEELEGLEPRMADVVRMRVVWTMSSKEIAEALDVSETTIKNDWRFARAWLVKKMGG